MRTTPKVSSVVVIPDINEKEEVVLKTRWDDEPLAKEVTPDDEPMEEDSDHTATRGRSSTSSDSEDDVIEDWDQEESSDVETVATIST